MVEFIVIVIVLTILALFFFAPALFKTSRLPAENYDERNTQIARERLDELKQSLTSGEMSQANFDAAKQELEANLAIDLSTVKQNNQNVENSDKTAALILMVAVPVVTVVLYMQLGHPDAIDAKPGEVVAQKANEAGDKPKVSMQEAVVKLAARLKKEPENSEGWFMLARTYMVMKRYDEAIAAFEKTMTLVGDDANILVRYADALAMANKGVLNGAPRKAINKALALDPQNQQGLWLAGVAAIETKEFKLALKHMLVLQPLLASNAEALSQLHNMIERTEQNLTMDEIKQVQASLPEQLVPSRNTVKSDAPVSTNQAEIQLTVSLDASLKGQVSPQDVIFIYAKAMNGPPMPLAAVKKTVAELPITVTLNDAMAMMPAMKLSSFNKVKVGAKISRAGVAGAAAGDLFGEIENVDTRSTDKVSIVINSRR